MKIAVDVRCLNGDNPTGVANYTWQALRSLRALDNNDQYFLFNSGHKTAASLSAATKKLGMEYRIWQQANRYLNLKFILGIGPNLPDIFATDLDLCWLPNMNFFRFDKNLPTVLTVHDLSWLHSQNFYDYKRTWWHRLINIKKLLNSVDHIMAVSENTKRDIIRFFTIDQNKISVIYPGVETMPMNETKAVALTGKLNLPPNYWLFVGTLEPRKNLAAVIKAFARLHQEYPDVHLVLAGGRGWLYRKILHNIKDKPYIHYLDYLASPQKEAVYFLSQGLIWPSFYEGFGFPPLESLVLGRPVITSYKTSMPEVLGQQALYVDPYNPADIYQILKHFLREPSFYQQYREMPASKIASWSEAAIAIHDVFEKIKK